MAHMAKYTQAQVGHLFNHYNRDKEKDCNRSNEDIDKTRTHENYNLMEREQTPQEYFKDRLDEVYHIDRKDINVMCDWIVTLPKDYNGDTREFFTHTVDFLNSRYGADNCIGAFVHMDEKTPHLHYSFIPVMPDDKHKDYDLKLNAKKVVSRSDLQSFHGDLQKYLRDRMPDREINVITGITKEQGRNMTVEELKLNAKIERIKEKEKEISEREEKLKGREERLKEQKRENLEREKALDKKNRELKQREKGLQNKERDLNNREQDIKKEEERQKEFTRYTEYRERYCKENGLTPAQYERECFTAQLTKELKPYPEMINPTLEKQERDELIKGYTEIYKEQHEHEKEHEKELSRDR